LIFYKNKDLKEDQYLYINIPFKMATINAPATPEASKKKWNNKIFNEIGANNIKENATHLLNNNNDPIRISNNATVFNKYPVAANEDMNAAAL
jgi:hypothetical protein